MTIQTINPATGQNLKTYMEMSKEIVFQVIEDTHAAWSLWREISFTDRAILMQRLIMLLEQRKQSYAELMTQEMGKPITAALAEIKKCQSLCLYYKDHAEEMLAPHMISTNMKKSYTCYQPLGVLFAIMPWNFPFWQVFRFAAPNIMGGNAILLNHAPINTGVALAIEQLFCDADFPTHLFRSLIIDHSTAVDIIHHPLVKGVTLTGSQRAGKIIGAEAGKALKKICTGIRG